MVIVVVIIISVIVIEELVDRDRCVCVGLRKEIRVGDLEVVQVGDEILLQFLGFLRFIRASFVYFLGWNMQNLGIKQESFR